MEKPPNILIEKNRSGQIQIADNFDRYNHYLESVKSSMPKGAYYFASANWHYDYNDHKCPHDSWVESVSVKEESSGERSEVRSLHIEVNLLGAYHDGIIELIYKNVVSYKMSHPLSQAKKKRNHTHTNSHGDWLADEVLLAEGNVVIHDIYFSTGSHWVIKCEDIQYKWLPLKR